MLSKEIFTMIADAQSGELVLRYVKINKTVRTVELELSFQSDLRETWRFIYIFFFDK